MKHFLVILAIVALVWFGVSMSELDDYPMQVNVEMTGYDTIRYAVVSRDSVLHVNARMSGFDALVNTLRNKDCTITVEMPEGHETVAVSQLEDQLTRAILRVRQVTCDEDSLHLVIAPRSHRSYVPQIDDVNFSFDEQCGLYGEPRVTPEVVTLYGPEEALASIDELRLAACNLRNIDHSATYRLPLQPVWQQFSDVHPSSTYVEVYLPVEPYVERTFRVPITVLGADTTVSLKLYPEEASVRVWIAQRDLNRVPEFVVGVNYSDVFLRDGHLTPQLLEFPSFVRPRNVEPSEIQCVVIK